MYRKGRSFDTAVTLHNGGRFAVTLTGLGSDPAARTPVTAGALLTTDSATASTKPSNLNAFRSFRLGPGDSAIVVVRWRLDCSGSTREAAADSVRLRYRYLSVFTRTRTVKLPFAITLRCVGGPPASP